MMLSFKAPLAKSRAVQGQSKHHAKMTAARKLQESNQLTTFCAFNFQLEWSAKLQNFTA
jgi:hypothetical protein